MGCGKIITASKVNTLDIKGAITLAVTINTLLLAITYLGSAGTSNIIGSIEFFGFLVWLLFPHTIHNHREENNVTANRLEIIVTQDNPASKYYHNDIWNYDANGISDYTYFVNKAPNHWALVEMQ